MNSGIVGRVLLNQYRVEEYIASGGMASVFRVRDLKRNVPLAMKVLQTDLAEDPSMLKRFQREARALQKLTHPHIVPFYGLFHVDDFYFLLELYIDGPSLKDILRQAPNHALSIHDSLVFAKALCSAVGYAHANGVVHCDIKPGNVMVDCGGNIYLTDFGIARHSDSTATTMAGAGTVAYMAPEQIREDPVTPATDIYALGVLIFELLAGRRPFSGDENLSDSKGKSSTERLRYAHLKLKPPDLSEFRPDLPNNLSKVILKALSKNPEDRFLSAMDFFIALCEAAGIDQVSLGDRVEQQGLNRTPSQVSSNIVPPEPLPETPQLVIKNIRRYLWIPAGLLVVAALAIFLPGSFGNSAKPILSETVVVTEVPESGIISTATTSPTITPLPKLTATIALITPPTVTVLPVETKQNPQDNAEMVRIPSGKFWMGANSGESPVIYWGAEAPRHQVFLDEYWIYRTEVTNQMYARCVDAAACPKPVLTSTTKYPNYFVDPKYKDYPVVNVTWTSAQSYCVWAKGQLPTEAQWEKAARGNDQRFFPWGNQLPGSTRANFCDVNCPEDGRDKSQDDGFAEAAPVGKYKDGASDYGVFDMGGNVSEWVHDWFNAGYYQISAEKNPTGPATGTTRVIRGGSWFNPIEGLQTVVRPFYQPTRYFSFLGFRCVVAQSE